MPQPIPQRFFTLVSLRTGTPHHHRTIFDGTFKLVRDRGLDHAVEREKNLKPLLSLKTLIKNEPSKSLPVSLIKRSLQLPFRPIEFIRKYPSFFEEFLPVPSATHPHVRLTPEALALDAEEQIVYQSDQFKQQAADKLLKLLMISRIHKIPLRLVDGLQWDLGLPPNYVETIVPEFPDYFRASDGFLELVCWSHELAVSVLQNRNGRDLGFPVQFSNGFEMDKKYEKWLREWQKLPYVSPYENASHLSSTSDESDRWVVGVMHEILHVFVGKKIEKDSLLEVGEWLGLRSRFKRALLQHPGIFYVSSKIGTYTVVLREGYKRGSLIEDDSETDVDEDEERTQRDTKRDSRKIATGRSGRDFGKVRLDADKPSRDSWRERSPLRDSRRERSPLRDSGRERLPLRDSRREGSMGKTRERNSLGVSERRQVRGVHKDVENAQQRSRSSTSSGRSLTSNKTPVF